MCKKWFESVKRLKKIIKYLQISKIFCIFVKSNIVKNQKMHLSSLIIMLLIGFGVSFFETDPILICVYTICIAFLLSIVIPMIINNLKED